MIIQWKWQTDQGIISVRVREELWTEVPDIVQKAGIMTIPEKKKCKRAKGLSEEALKIAEKARVPKGKGVKKWYTYLKVEFQRIARRDKKAFFLIYLIFLIHYLSISYLSLLLQWSKKRNRGKQQHGKTRDLFKKIRDTKGTFHAKMGTRKDKNVMDLTEAEDIQSGGKNS